MVVHKKKEKNVTDNDPDELGDVYTLTSMKPDTRLWLSHHEGGRTTEDAIELFNDIEKKRSLDSPIPVFTSDNWDAFEVGLINVYSTLEHPPYKGKGRRPLPVLIPLEDLKYAIVIKKREKGRVVEVVQEVVLGDPSEVLALLGADEGGKINTAYIERLNLTIRNSLARFIRRTMNSSKDVKMHSKALDFIQAWYNFVKHHRSLRLPIKEGIKKWKQRTPAMAEGLTDHIWTLEELLSFRTPIQS